MAAVLTALIQRKYKESIFYTSALIVSFLSTKYLLNYLNAETVNINEQSNTILAWRLDEYINKTYIMISNTLPKLLFKLPPVFTELNISLVVITGVVTVFFIYKALQDKNKERIVISIWLVFILGFFVILPYPAERFLILVLPLLFLLIFSYEFNKKAKLYIVSVFLFLNIISTSVISYIHNYVAHDGEEIKEFSLALEDRFNNINYKYSVISYDPRLTYFMLGEPSVTNIDKLKNDKVLVIGDNEFLASRIGEIRDKYKIRSIKKLDISYHKIDKINYAFFKKNEVNSRIIHAVIVALN